MGVQQNQTQFLLRRLQSLTGIFPVGGYLCFHLFENLAALSGPERFNEIVHDIEKLAPLPYFYIIEWSLILIPLLIHSLLGMMIWFSGQPNPLAYPYRRNWLYTLQRWTGGIGFLFILSHFLQWRWAVLMRGTPITYADITRDLAGVPMLTWYLVGVLSLCFHFGNGLYGFCYSWGITVGKKSQRMMEYVGWGAFVATSIVAVNILVSLHLAGVAHG